MNANPQETARDKPSFWNCTVIDGPSRGVLIEAFNDYLERGMKARIKPRFTFSEPITGAEFTFEVLGAGKESTVPKSFRGKVFRQSWVVNGLVFYGPNGVCVNVHLINEVGEFLSLRYDAYNHVGSILCG